MDTGSSSGVFKFRRPWETPPRQDESYVEDLKLPVKTEPMENKDNIIDPAAIIDGTDSQVEENFEIFRFDKDNLTLTSEKRVNRKSLEEPSSASAPPVTSEVKEGSSCSTKLSSPENTLAASPNGVIKAEIDVEVKLEVDSEDVSGKEEEDEDSIDEDDDEDDEDSSGEGEEKVALGDDEFPDGRNKERKNSKWADYGVTRKSSRLSGKSTFCNKAHRAQVLKKLTSLLKKSQEELTDDEKMNIEAFPELAKEARKRLEKRLLASERLKEEEDPEDLLKKKCSRLASVISRAKYLVVYTGAGISTSASIPDYRGPNGIWTLLRKGQSVAEDLKQFPQSADPTITHMAIKALYEKGIIKHIVSQNVDGLHLRSGIPKTALSEVHGNMYIEVCNDCHREYVRLFDVTENTKRHHHKTGRSCYHCGCPLKDSVVLFGEKGSLRWPINWAGAEYNVDKADVILCLGSSLKVLRRYPWLWCMSKPPKQRPKLLIVNLQWTPKDRFAALKINGRCDEVIAEVMDNLQIPIPVYKRESDSIFRIATLLHPSELSTKLSKDLTLPEGIPYPDKSTDLRNYFRFEPVFSKEVRALNQVKRKIVDGEDDEKDIIMEKSKSCGIGGWLGNALPKKKKVKQNKKDI